MKILLKLSSAIVNALVLLFTLSFIICNYSKADWEYVGNPAFVSNWSFVKGLAILGNTPYISLNGSVMKYDGTDWVNVGPVNAFNGYQSSIAFSGNTPFIAFIDSDHNAKISVMKFNGIDWEYVGNPGFSAKSIWVYAIISISNGVPYVGFIEAEDMDHKIVGVMKFDGTNWNYVGNLGVPIYPSFLSFAVNSGIPYVAYTSWDGVIRSIVRKYDGVSWVTVGQSPIGSGTTEYNSLVFCETPPYENVPYIAFHGGEADLDGTVVKRFNGNLWVSMGSAVGSFTWEHSMAMSGIIPYVAYEAYDGLKVIKLEGGSWIDISPNTGGTRWPCLAINNGTPYVSFNSGGSVSVMYLDHPLPVELIAFVSSVEGRNVILNWSTSSETDNSGFDIERKIMNGTWIKTGHVAGHGTTTSPVNYTFSDLNLGSEVYCYRLKQIDFNGNFQYFNLSNDINIGIPSKFEVYQNYPNPFNPSTKISFDLPIDSKVKISVFDMTGREAGILTNELKQAGFYSVDFNASGLSSGIYYFTVSAGSFIATKKMTLIK